MESAPAAYVCLCPPGVEGATCDVIGSANFDGRTALTFTSLVQLSNIGPAREKRDAGSTTKMAVGAGELQVQFTMTTTVLDGILFVITGVSETG